MKFLAAFAQPKIILFFFISQLIFSTLIFPHYQNQLENITGEPLPVLDIRFSYNLETVQNLFDQYGTEGIAISKKLHYLIDMLYPLFYGGFLALFLIYLMGKHIWVGWLPLIGVVLDVAENLSILSLLNQYPNLTENMVQISSFFTLGKWITLGISVLLVLYYSIQKLTKLFLLLPLLFLMSCGPIGEQRPNIVFILADDQRADALGIYGNAVVQTPHIDQLAQEGTRFNNAYIMGGHHGAICAPSRAMLMSGQNLFRVYDRLNGVRTMPMAFREAGYRVFGTGKWHNEKEAFEAAFSDAKSVYLGGMANHFEVPVRDYGPDGQLGEPVRKGFSTRIFTEACLSFIDQHISRNDTTPFFAYIAYTAPHDPYSPDFDYINRYQPNQIPLPENFLGVHPFNIHDPLVRDENLTGWPRHPDTIQMILADYYGLISQVDDEVGRIIKLLKEKGVYDNTIIVYAADNGLAIGSHGLLGKQNLYEHSIKIPLIIKGPNIPSGKVSNAFAYLLDMFPTLGELAGVQAPSDIDGQSLVPILEGETSNLRNEIFTAYRNVGRALSTKDWKLIEYPGIDHTQLFDLTIDPNETNDLSTDTQWQPTIDSLRLVMQQWQRNTGDTLNLDAQPWMDADYDFHSLRRKPDHWQPQYTLEKYFNQD
jgi:arylsulfatase A-like enzyme